MTLRVSIQDLETGDIDERDVAEGDYVVIAHAPCRVANVRPEAGGERHIITVVGRVG